MGTFYKSDEHNLQTIILMGNDDFIIDKKNTGSIAHLHGQTLNHDQ